MKILFLYPSWTGDYGIFSHFARRAGVFPPLNFALLAAISEQHGHNVMIIDAEAERIPLKKLIGNALSYNPDIIGLTARSPFFHLSKELAIGIKKLNDKVPIAIGGQHITIMKEKAFLPCFDYAFIGEAERSWPQFLEKLQNGNKDFSESKGLIYRKNGESTFTGIQEITKDLDSLPFPARHLLNMERYKLGTLHGMENFTTIQTVRGCPWKCIFCASDDLNTTAIRKRSPELVIKEIKEVIDRYNVRHFMFLDDVLTLNEKHILKICDLLIEEKLKITFEGSTRANLINEDMIRKMKDAGLIRLSFGLETVDEEMRNTMNKKVPLEAYSTANKILNKYNIEALNSVMIGLPGETRETVRKTLEWLRNAREVKQANFAIAVPYPGTEFYRMAKAGEGGVKLITDDFSKYRRYGSAVTVVNELGPQDLIELQNEGFVSIYSASWRWIPMLKKNGIIGGMLMLLRVFRLIVKKFSNNFLNKKNEVLGGKIHI